MAGFPSSREPMVFFQDIIHAATEEDALGIATSWFWENILIESAGEDMLETMYRADRLGRWLPDNLYLYCVPIYTHQLQKCWKIVYASMKSFHEMRAAFARLGVIETEPSKGRAIRKK
ncbi:MAG: hypothetical protein Q8Q10_02980 [bacterium]|nr:hypothetical protein [bacterium]